MEAALIYAIVMVALSALFCKYRWGMILVPIVIFVYCLAQGLFVAGLYDG